MYGDFNDFLLLEEKRENCAEHDIFIMQSFTCRLILCWCAVEKQLTHPHLSKQKKVQKMLNSVGCGSAQYACDNGRCINHFHSCDGINHCGDFSDERHCSMFWHL